MTYMRTSLVALFLLFSTLSLTPTQKLCEGFLPPNDWKIPVRTGIGALNAGGLTEKEFNDVLDSLTTYYTPVMSSMGGNLHINRNWTDDTVNASATRSGSDWVLNMYGGLARVPVMTKDGFLLVACHETGHHLGGAPKVDGWFGNDWASNEGEADYYATLSCLRFVFNDKDNSDFVANNTIDPVLKVKCETIYSNIPDRNLCMRSGTAGMVTGLVFQSMGSEASAPKFDTPDTHTVSRTDDDHPATQCRLDTYYAGSICFHDIHQALSDTDPNQGTCNLAHNDKDGTRPLCWFKP